MGHIHLGRLPRTRLWQDVVSLIDANADVASIADASARAAERSLLDASGDPVFAEAVRLLVGIPIAARQEDFGDGLRQLDLEIAGPPTLFNIMTAVGARLGQIPSYHTSARTDLGELASRALQETLSSVIGRDLPGLFGPSAEDVQLSFRKFSYSSGIAVLTRNFFGGLVGTSLSYWLDRVLAGRIGAGERFADVAKKVAFDHALHLHVHEATRIVQEFSGGWVGKQMHDRGRIDTPDARNFGHVCLKKIVEELQARRGWHA